MIKENCLYKIGMPWRNMHEPAPFTPEEIIIFTRAPRLRAPRGARRGSSVFSKMLPVIDPPRGRPVGGGGTYHNRGYGGLNPHYSVFLEFDFHRK